MRQARPGMGLPGRCMRPGSGVWSRHRERSSGPLVTRFARPAQLMSYLGLVPSENTTGESRRQGALTKTGSRHARRLLVEAAWHYRKTPSRGITRQRRQDGQPAPIVELSWKAQRRLYRVWQRLDTERGKRRTIVAVAVARELAGFCWAITTAD
jgi:transposase